MVHWHSSRYHKFQRAKEEVVKLVFCYVSEATLKTKVFMRSDVLSCLKTGYCWFNVQFILTVINHDKRGHVSEVVLVGEVVEF